MAVGRNLGYRLSIVSLNPSEDPPAVAGGDDDLLINRIGRDQQSWVVTHSDSHMLSQPKSTIKEFLIQKRRHTSTSVHYNVVDRIFLLLFAASAWWHLVGVMLLIMFGLWLPAIMLYLFRLLSQVVRVKRIFKFSEYYQFGFWIPVVDLVYMIYYPLLALFILQKSPARWK